MQQRLNFLEGITKEQDFSIHLFGKVKYSDKILAIKVMNIIHNNVVIIGII